MDFFPAPTPAELEQFYRRSGYQVDVTLPALMTRNRDEFGDLVAVIDGDVELTWRQLIDQAARFAGFLQANGVGAGDVVVWQLPNWWESLVVAYGIWAVGAVSSPVVPIYRSFELRNVIGAVSPRCAVTAQEFRGVDHADMVASACADVGCDPPVRVVLRGSVPGWTSFDDTLTASPVLVDHVDVDAPALVGWTSGTTSGAKGVAHSTRSFVASPLRTSRWLGSRWDDRSYMPAPIAHATGLLSCIAVPLFTGSSTVIRDGWDADRAIDDIARYGVTTRACGGRVGGGCRSAPQLGAPPPACIPARSARPPMASSRRAARCGWSTGRCGCADRSGRWATSSGPTPRRPSTRTAGFAPVTWGSWGRTARSR